MLLHEIKKQVFFVGAYKWVYEIMKVEKKKKSQKILIWKI